MLTISHHAFYLVYPIIYYLYDFILVWRHSPSKYTLFGDHTWQRYYITLGFIFIYIAVILLPNLYNKVGEKKKKICILQKNLKRGKKWKKMEKKIIMCSFCYILSLLAEFVNTQRYFREKNKQKKIKNKKKDKNKKKKEKVKKR